MSNERPRYGSCRWRTEYWALVVAGLELIYLIYQLLNTVSLFFNTNGRFVWSLWLSTVWLLLAVAAVVLLVAAVFTGSQQMLIPHLVLQMSIVAILFLEAGYCGMNLLLGTTLPMKVLISWDDMAMEQLASLGPPIERMAVSNGLFLFLLIALFAFIIAGSMQIGLLFVVLACYRQLRERALELRNIESAFLPRPILAAITNVGKETDL